MAMKPVLVLFLLLAIALVISSSDAFGIGGFSPVGKIFKGGDVVNGLPKVKEINVVKPKVKENFGTGFPPLPEHAGAEKVVDSIVKNIGVFVVGKLFGEDAKKGFKFGWRVRKRYYAVQSKCEKYEKSLGINCDHRSLLPTCLAYCVVEVLENTENASNCHDNCGVPLETPCTYSDGFISPNDDRCLSLSP